jgi:hypothetical protein
VGLGADTAKRLLFHAIVFGLSQGVSQQESHGLCHRCRCHVQAWAFATRSPTSGWCYPMPPEWEGWPHCCRQICKLPYASTYDGSYVLTCLCSPIWSVWTWRSSSCPSGTINPYTMWNSWAKGSRSVPVISFIWSKNSLNLLQPACWYVEPGCKTSALSYISVVCISCLNIGHVIATPWGGFQCITNEATLALELLRYGAKSTDKEFILCNYIRQCALSLMYIEGPYSDASAAAMVVCAHRLELVAFNLLC